jgi:hypothetical protein
MAIAGSTGPVELGNADTGRNVYKEAPCVNRFHSPFSKRAIQKELVYDTRKDIDYGHDQTTLSRNKIKDEEGL